MKKKELLNTLLDKVSSIGLIKNEEINLKLNQLNSITDKLNYLKIIKESFYDKLIFLEHSLNEIEYDNFLINRAIYWNLVYEDKKFISNLCIPESIYKSHIESESEKSEYIYWFLKFEANILFEKIINENSFKQDIFSDLKEANILKRLNELNKMKDIAMGLLINNKIDIRNWHTNNSRYPQEIILLRVLDGNYYKNTPKEYPYRHCSPEVQMYAKYILLKPYLEKLLKNEINYLIGNKNVENYNSYPVFRHEIVDTIFSFLKHYFDINQHNELKSILEDGNDLKSKLIFKGNANQLADAFKQLINGNLITGCKKETLEKWVFKNFQYSNNKDIPTDFKLRYLQDIISTNKDSCKKPIFDVKKIDGIYTITEV